MNGEILALLKQIAIMMAPDPSDSEIEMQYKLDRMKNPHNESHKPKLRDRIEIILDYKIAAYNMLAQRRTTNETR